MPRDANGNTQPLPGTIVSTGDTVLPSQHNPMVVDLYAMMTQSLSREGQGGMLANLNFSTFKGVNLADGTANSDAVNYGQVNSLFSAISQGTIIGLTFSNDPTDPSNDFRIANGTAASDNAFPKAMTLGAQITKRLDAPWAPGSGAGALDTGSVAASSTYHNFLIMRPDTGAVDVLSSLSAVTPVMPANYTLKRRINSMIRTTGAINQIYQIGNTFRRPLPFTINGTFSAFPSTLINAGVPTGVVMQPILSIAVNSTGGSSGVYSIGSAQDGGAPMTACVAFGANAARANVTNGFFTNLSAQMFFKLDVVGSLSAAAVENLGWIDLRGTNG